MQTISRLHRSGVGVAPDRTIADVAKLMNNSGVGSIAVLDDDRLVGVVTDRDLVRRGLACDLPPDARVDGVMTAPALTIEADAPLHDAVDAFSRHAVRRLAVVHRGRFVGMISLDDLLLDLAGDLRSLTAPLAAEIASPQRDSLPPVAI